MIRIEHLSKAFGRLQVFENLSLVLAEKKIIALLGPNGSGKTSLLKILLGLVKPDAGKIWLSDKQIYGQGIRNDAYRSEINYLPQMARFPDNLTAKELVSLIQDIRNETAPQLMELLKMTGLAPYMNKRLKHLSGGTRQKVNILLAFMLDKPIYFMDEPTVGLDPITMVHFKDYLKRMHARGKSMLLTTHIASLVEELAEEIIFLLNGKVFFQGSPEALKELGQADTLEIAIAHILEKQDV